MPEEDIATKQRRSKARGRTSAAASNCCDTHEVNLRSHSMADGVSLSAFI